MKNFILGTILALVSTIVSASPIISDFRLNGDVYIDTSLANETRAIGIVNTLYIDNVETWASGDSVNGSVPLYVYMVASGITPLISPSAPLFVFSGFNGTMDLYASVDANLLDTSQDWVTSNAAITGSSSLLLGTNFHNTINGISSGVAYAANGFLEVVNGSFANNVVTGGVTDYDGVTDLSFNASGAANTLAPIVNTDYQYITTANITGKTTGLSTVPVPGTVWMMLSAIGALGVSRRKLKV